MRLSNTTKFVQDVHADRFWVIGDLHGMRWHLHTMLYKIAEFELSTNVAGRPQNKTAIISVGDICDRGYYSLDTMRDVELLNSTGYEGMPFYSIKGNHDEKLERVLTADAAGRLAISKIQMKHGLDKTWAEFSVIPTDERARYLTFLRGLPLTIRMVTSLRDGVAVHAAFDLRFYGHHDPKGGWSKERTMEYAIYGPVRSVSPEGKPDRIAWEDDYVGSYVFYGHKVVGETPKFSPHACGVDTGCFESGILSAVSFPDGYKIQVRTELIAL